MCKIKLNCNNVNEIREERIANSVLYWFGHLLCLRLVLKQSTWDFYYPCKFLYNFWTTQGYLSLVFRKTYKSRDPLPLDYNNSLLLKYRRCFFLFKRRIIQLEELIRILNCFASVWPKIFFWENKTMKFWKFLNIFEHKSHIYRPLVAFQKLMKGCDFSELFLKFSHW